MSSEAQRLVRTLDAKQDNVAPDQVSLEPLVARPPKNEVTLRQPGVVDEQFPTGDLGAKEKMDRVEMAKLRLQDPSNPGVTPFGRLQARDEDFKWLLRKEAAVEQANFELWFAQNFDHMSPAEKKRARELFPKFYEARNRQLKKNTETIARLAMIKINGVESMDDLYTLYLAETGRLNLDNLSNVLSPSHVPLQSAYQQQQTFERGLHNPFRPFGNTAVPTKPEETMVETRAREVSA